MLSNGLMTTLEAAKMLRVHPQTMINWRWFGYGPKYIKRGKWVAYHVSSVEKYKKKMLKVKVGPKPRKDSPYA